MATCGSSLIKLCLMILNFILLALGIAIAYCGYKLFDSEALKITDFKNISVVILIVGVVIVVIAGFGFFGSCLNSSCMLNSYGLLLVILIAAEVFLVYRSIKTDTNLSETIEKGMIEAINKIQENPDTAIVLQRIQQGGKCCGWNGPDDYDGSNVLASCCSGEWDGTSPTQTCLKTHATKTGCEKSLHFDTLKTYLKSSTAVGIVLILAQLVLIFAACCLARDV